MNSKEEWKEINGFPNYRISNLGNVYNINSNEYIKPFNNNGYKRVNLYYNRKQKSIYVHRLVAEAFLDNFNNCRVINHKDEDKTNNSVENLEWCTFEYNINYGTRTLRANKTNTNGKLSKPVLQFTLDGEFVREWESTMECGRNGFNQGHVAECCRGERKSHKGYIWKYKE